MTSDNADGALSYRAALELAMSLVRGRWHIAVLCVLVGGERRFADVRDAVNAIDRQVRPASRRAALTDRPLTSTLDKLRETGLVTRRKTSGVPAESWYQLTPLARAMLARLQPFGDWAHGNQHVLIQAIRGGPEGG